MALEFELGSYQDVFAAKNNKTVSETLAHKRYSSLASETVGRFPDRLDEPLGSFLLSLKVAGDEFYKRFLNRYGDLQYSIFRIGDARFLNEKGIYAYFSGAKLLYIGRCKDSMKKRINQGYGKIHPKNCFRDGQATNCHLNARITKQTRKPSLWLHSMQSESDIVSREIELIGELKPPWNIQLA